MDDKELLSRAYTEIARLKSLLAQALKRLDEGGGSGGGGGGGSSGMIGSTGLMDGEEMMKMREENHQLRQENESMKRQLQQLTLQKKPKKKPVLGTNVPYTSLSAGAVNQISHGHGLEKGMKNDGGGSVDVGLSGFVHQYQQGYQQQQQQQQSRQSVLLTRSSIGQQNIHPNNNINNNNNNNNNHNIFSSIHTPTIVSSSHPSYPSLPSSSSSAYNNEFGFNVGSVGVDSNTPSHYGSSQLHTLSHNNNNNNAHNNNPHNNNNAHSNNAHSNNTGIARGVSYHASPGQVLGKYKPPPDVKGDPPACHALTYTLTQLNPPAHYYTTKNKHNHYLW